jgi:membrane-associated phospholipid phosphatase
MLKSYTESPTLKALNASVLGFTALLFLLTIIYSSKVDDWLLLASKLLLGGFAYYFLSNVINKISSGFWQILSRGLLIAGVSGFLFGEIQYLQHIWVSSWMDDYLVRSDQWLFGVESSVALQTITIPVVTEIMMFAYTIYVPLIVIVAVFCYQKSGLAAGEDYMLNLILAYFVSFVGFLVFPIAGPLFHQPEDYAVPLNGWIFTYFGEWIRANAHYPGGNFPSPHCAAGTVMLVTLFRYNRNYFWVILPIIILLYISTVYGRYHFAMDGVAGIIVGILVVKLSSKLIRN